VCDENIYELPLGVERAPFRDGERFSRPIKWPSQCVQSVPTRRRRFLVSAILPARTGGAGPVPSRGRRCIPFVLPNRFLYVFLPAAVRVLEAARSNAAIQFPVRAGNRIARVIDSFLALMAPRTAMRVTGRRKKNGRVACKYRRYVEFEIDEGVGSARDERKQTADLRYRSQFEQTKRRYLHFHGQNHAVGG
jgi:hypothetical protein